MLTLALVALVLAAAPAALFLVNLRLYRPPPVPRPHASPPAVSVLIPARDEEGSIRAAVEAALASRGVELEVVVLDDGSRDATAAVVARLAHRDPRVRLPAGPPLPAGWCGKQHACAVLAGAARHPLLVFVDADVRLAPEGLARTVAFLHESGADLVSGVPRQETGSLAERLLIPLIHFLLLGYLPLWRMRRNRHPAYAAGCGQLIAVRRAAHVRAGGHGAIRSSLHDGITLPRAFRRAGLGTDLFDATDVASCRMYCGTREAWRGLAKNAVEGLAGPRVIVPATVLLLGGQVLPFLLLAATPWLSAPALVCAAAAAATALLPRLAAVLRFRQSWLGALLHPVGIVALLSIQWFALLRAVRGQSAQWKGRTYQPATSADDHNAGARGRELAPPVQL
jgi:hypothetical protein